MDGQYLHKLANEVALSLPETNISQPFGEECDVFKAFDKVFMLSFSLNDKAVINLKVNPDHGVMLRDIYPYIHSGWHMNKKHWISVYEHDELDKTLLKDLIKDSYELVVSKLNKFYKQRIELLR